MKVFIAINVFIYSVIVLSYKLLHVPSLPENITWLESCFLVAALFFFVYVIAGIYTVLASFSDACARR